MFCRYKESTEIAKVNKGIKQEINWTERLEINE